MTQAVITYARKPGVVHKRLGQEILLYSAEMEAVHVLNPSAVVIWELCDGEHTLAEIEAGLRERFAVGTGHEIRSDIQRALTALLEKDLVQVKQTDVSGKSHSV